MATSDALRTYVPSGFPQLGHENLPEDVVPAYEAQRRFLIAEFNKLRDALRTVQQVIQALDTTKTPLGNYASDAAAAAAGVTLNGLYHTNGTVKMRLV